MFIGGPVVLKHVNVISETPMGDQRTRHINKHTQMREQGSQKKAFAGLW